MPRGEVVKVPATGLFIAPCSRKAALRAMRWHYSGTLPSGKCLYWGIWFDGVFIGVVIISRGACANIGRRWNLPQDRIAEVSRISLRSGHAVAVSRVLAIVVRLLRRSNPGLELLISYSDQRQRHTGLGVYGACGWAYLGQTAREATLWIRGREVHARTVSSKYGTRDLAWLRANVDPQVRRIDCPPKHRWALALSSAMREPLARLAQPYPKRERGAENGTAVPTAGRGVIPTRSLHSDKEAAHVG
jgi:hypothetical protein